MTPPGQTSRSASSTGPTRCFASRSIYLLGWVLTGDEVWRSARLASSDPSSSDREGRADGNYHGKQTRRWGPARLRGDQSLLSLVARADRPLVPAKGPTRAPHPEMLLDGNKAKSIHGLLLSADVFDHRVSLFVASTRRCLLSGHRPPEDHLALVAASQEPAPAPSSDRTGQRAERA